MNTPANHNGTPEPKQAVKPTNAELAQRIEEVGAMLAKGLTRSEIHAECCPKWGVGWRAIDRYVSRARGDALAEIGADKRNLISEAYGTYKHAIREGLKAGNLLAAIRAQERIDKLLGLEAHQRVEVKVTPAPSASMEHLSEEELGRIIALADAHAAENANRHFPAIRNGKAE